jgi:hypothetical protein
MSSISIPHEDVVRHLVPRASHDIFSIPGEANRMPRRAIDEILEAMQRRKQPSQR